MKRWLVVGVACVIVPWLSLVGLVALFVEAARADGSACGGSGAVAADGQAASGSRLAAVVAEAAGFTGQDLVIAVAVAGAESSYQPTVRNSIGASGLWQILERAHPDLFARYDWRDPAQNAVMAHAVWGAAGKSWTPWTTWTSGAYRSHLAEAGEAVAFLQSAGAPDSVPPGGCPPNVDGLPGEARPFSGADGYTDDPTSSGHITRRMLHIYDEVQRAFGGWPWGVGCWDPHAWNPTSDHPKGKACDFAVGRIGVFPVAARRAKGWQLAHWLQANARVLGITYVIWDGRIWSTARSAEGWRLYSGGGIYDPRTPTGGHFDHVHASSA